MKTIKTELHTYHFDLKVKADAQAYEKLCEKLLATPGRGHWLNCISMQAESYIIIPGPVKLQTEHLFDNQWNTETQRVFDWYEGIFPNLSIKQGHYLDITPEMIKVRKETLKCQYTGMQFPASCGQKFNLSDRALGSEYLKPEELYLLRLLPIDTPFNRKLEKLSEQETAFLMPLYQAAQRKAKTAALEQRKIQEQEDVNKKLVEAERKSAQLLVDAKIEHAGMRWLINHDINISLSNVIYYHHSGRFGFGWRDKFSTLEASKLVKALKVDGAFPYPYDIQTHS